MCTRERAVCVWRYPRRSPRSWSQARRCMSTPVDPMIPDCVFLPVANLWPQCFIYLDVSHGEGGRPIQSGARDVSRLLLSSLVLLTVRSKQTYVVKLVFRFFFFHFLPINRRNNTFIRQGLMPLTHPIVSP